MTASTPTASLSVIVPMYNAPENLERCLAGLGRSSVPFELIVVDDRSTDAQAIEIGRACGGRYHRLDQNSGPAVARNEGSKLAACDVLVFIDSDCVVHTDTLEKIGHAFAEDPGLGALFGSYDDSPGSPGLVSVYRNLLHHFTHHTGPKDASTFWAGCGAVRRRVFLENGGFDESYRRPMIEDIELGMRLRAAGVRIHLLPDIQVKHLKKWRLFEMVRVDVTCRAIPWTRLLIDRPETGGDLNLESAQKLCVVLVFLAAAGLVSLSATAAYLATPWILALLVPVALLLPVLWINRALYRMFLSRRGPFFALAAIGLHLFYFVYGGFGFLYAHLTHRTSGARPVSAA